MTGLEKLLLWKGVSGSGGSLVENTVIGNPATFTTNIAKEIVSMIIPISSTQEGSGAPSPNNVRPIIGQNGLVVYHSGEDTTNPDEITVFSGMMYGGEVNLLTGELIVTHLYATLVPAGKPDGVNWFYTTLGVLGFPDIEGLNAGLMCDRFPVVGNTTDHDTNPSVTIYANNIIRWIEPDCISMTLNEYKQYLVDNPDKVPHVCYKLKTAITGTVDPQTIKTVVGENNIWSNSIGNNTVVYLTRE